MAQKGGWPDGTQNFPILQDSVNIRYRCPKRKRKSRERNNIHREVKEKKNSFVLTVRQTKQRKEEGNSLEA